MSEQNPFQVEFSMSIDKELPPLAAGAMQIVAGMQTYVAGLKACGLTLDEALERSPMAIRRAWED